MAANSNIGFSLVVYGVTYLTHFKFLFLKKSILLTKKIFREFTNQKLLFSQRLKHLQDL